MRTVVGLNHHTTKGNGAGINGNRKLKPYTKAKLSGFWTLSSQNFHVEGLRV